MDVCPEDEAFRASPIGRVPRGSWHRDRRGQRRPGRQHRPPFADAVPVHLSGHVRHDGIGRGAAGLGRVAGVAETGFPAHVGVHHGRGLDALPGAEPGQRRGHGVGGVELAPDG